MAASSTFAGFPLGMLHFYEELSRNNHRVWFEANRSRYESEVREPALDFIRTLQKPMARLSPNLRVEAKKVGGSLMRIHRDVRFAKDKAPYKTNLGLHFRHTAGSDVHAPGFYFHADLEGVWLGVGAWRPASPALASFRSFIDQEGARWRRVCRGKRFTERWTLGGESLKRPPRGYEADHPMIEQLKLKDHLAQSYLTHDDLFSPDLVATVMDRYKRAKPYAAMLCDALDVEF